MTLTWVGINLKGETSCCRRIIMPTLLTLVILTACNLPGMSPAGSIPPALFPEARRVARNVRDAYLRLEIEWSTPVLADKQGLEVWYVRPDEMRLEIVESGQVGFRDIIFAVRGQQAWMYWHTTRQVAAGPVSSVRPAVVYEVVWSLLDLFFGQSFEETKTISRDYTNHSRAFKITGRKNAMTDPAAPGFTDTDNEGAWDCSLWLDENSLLPLKASCRSQGAIEYTATVREAQYNIGLNDDLFDIGFLPTQDYAVRRGD